MSRLKFLLQERLGEAIMNQNKQVNMSTRLEACLNFGKPLFSSFEGGCHRAFEGKRIVHYCRSRDEAV